MNAHAWSDAIFGVLAPAPLLTVSQWADSYRVIPRGTSPEAGPWRTSITPYLREPMDAISDPSIERVVCQWGSQLGKTDGLLLNSIGYYAHQDPSPILLVQPTEGAARAFSNERLEPMFRESPALAGKLADGLKNKDNTLLLKQFPGGYVALAWATSGTSLASRPIRVVLLDEVDKYTSLPNGGDPVEQAIQRAANFRNRKIIAVSTPEEEDTSRICRLYESSDQRRLWLPCPRCGAFQVLKWEGVIYKNDAGEIDVDGTYYRCAHCAGRIEERDRPEMLAIGEWRPDNPGHRHRGYQLSALYSPWVRWAELAAQWIEINAKRDRQLRKDFVNLRLGEPWVSAEEITAEGLDKNRIEYLAELPADVLLLTAGVDTQDNRLEVEIVGWGLGRESWGIHYAIISGDTLDVSNNGPWARLEELLSRSWLREDGIALGLYAACIDSRGHRTDVVYTWCRDRAARNWWASYGVDGDDKPIAGKMTLTKFKSAKYPVGVTTAKAVLYSRLALPDPGPGYCHFPSNPGRGYDSEYFRGLVSEKRVRKIRGGRPAYVWVPHYARNEPLDCRNYATAAMEIVNPDFAALAAQLAPQSSSTPPQPARRRVFSPGVSW